MSGWRALPVRGHSGALHQHHQAHLQRPDQVGGSETRLTNKRFSRIHHDFPLTLVFFLVCFVLLFSVQKDPETKKISVVSTVLKVSARVSERQDVPKRQPENLLTHLLCCRAGRVRPLLPREAGGGADLRLSGHRPAQTTRDPVQPRLRRRRPGVVTVESGSRFARRLHSIFFFLVNTKNTQHGAAVVQTDISA